VPVHGGQHRLLLGRVQRIDLPLRKAARGEVGQAIALQVPVAPEPGREAAQRAAVLVDGVRAQPARRSPQVGRLLGPMLQLPLTAQGALEGELVQRRLAAQKRGESRELLTVEAHGFRRETLPGKSRQLAPDGLGPWDRIWVRRPFLSRASTPRTHVWRGWGATGDQALRGACWVRAERWVSRTVANRPNLPLALCQERGTGFEPATSNVASTRSYPARRGHRVRAIPLRLFRVPVRRMNTSVTTMTTRGR